MIAESALGGAVRRLICLVEASIPMIPVRCHDGKHLAALQRHLDDVLVGKADGAFSRPRRSGEYIDGRFLNSLGVQSYIE
jgi:hypothetical protein